MKTTYLITAFLTLSTDKSQFLITTTIKAMCTCDILLMLLH